MEHLFSLGGSYEIFQENIRRHPADGPAGGPVLCLGLFSAYEASHSDPDSVVQSQRAGESGLNYFLNWIDDGAGLFSMETTDTLARNNLDLNNTYGCLLALKTVNYLNGQDIASYSKDLFQQVDLGRKDMLLVIESSSQAWYLVYGGGLRTYAENNDALAALLKDNLDTDFFQGESDAGILSLFDDLEHWCAETLPVLDDTLEPGNPFLQNDNKVQILSLGDVLLGILFTLLVNIWWIILLLVVLNLIDRHRFREYITKHPPGSLSNPRSFSVPCSSGTGRARPGTAVCCTW
ncbi:MAG: TPM domain-containing protein [Evtepia gabavorous]